MTLTATKRRPSRTGIAVVGTLTAVALSLTGCTGGGIGFSGGGDVNTVDAQLAASIDGAVESAMTLSGSTQAIIGVWTPNGDYVRAYGEGEIDGGTRFRGAQTTQPVLCALLLDAAGRGELKLDRKVQQDLPRQTGLGDITYEQLCGMRSGLADYKGRFTDIFANNPTRPWPEQELIAQGLAHSPQSWPGLDFHRSDTNMVLLGRALRIRSGESLQDQLQKRVFGPAGMGSSYFPDLESTTISGDSLAELTYPSSNKKPVCGDGPIEVPEVSPSMLAGAGATVTTAADLKNFYEHYLDGDFGGKGAKKTVTSTASMQNPKRDDDGNPKEEAPAPEPGDATWGFGTEKIGPLYGMSGSITGTLSAAYHDPESGTTVVVALNNSSAGSALARALSLQLATLSGLDTPWTAEAQGEAVAKRAVCQAE